MKRFSISLILILPLLFGGCAKTPTQNIQHDNPNSAQTDFDKTEITEATANNAQAEASDSSSRTANTEAVMLTPDEAEAKALTHAGCLEDKVTILKNKLDYENGRQVYEIEFYTSDYKEYDYEIDASSGEIISYDYEAEDFTPPADSGSGLITAEEAKNLALAKVEGAAEINLREFETDYDDGRTKFEGKIIYNGMEYEFEIDAQTGKFLSWEAELAD